ncbi:hypothetical protein L207DRAFT_476847 [Hyaloscypha variabilis F]|uniref:Rhodopsin domain-containing protein n=1 Tax=Hyaloscypha variabilis (strain UAMH 11265 / GT02V1 / F) TaxID=1149755 RepID=A0A2J6SCI3_HYAVF|nr:hypothetical protein L207DRAFT_476847 [Hyaloscypha variabilis F]
MAAVFNHHVTVSNENEGPVVNIAAWLGMTLTVLFVFIRIGSKWIVLRKWNADDTMIIVTMVLAIIHTIEISLMVVNGLGQPQSVLDSMQIESFERYGYASQLFYVPALCIAKLSTLVYLRALSPETAYAFVNQVLEVFIVLSGLGLELAIAFQCRLPDAWAIISGSCIDMVSFPGAFDILTDLAIILLPAYLVWGIQMAFKKKVLVVLIFGSRIFITPLTIFRLYYIKTISSPLLPNQTFISYHAYLATTIQLNAAIIISCIPFMKPFMESLSTGGFTSTLSSMDSSFNHGSKSKFSTFISSRSSRCRKATDPDSIGMDGITSPPDTHATRPIALRHSISAPAKDIRFGSQRPLASGSSQGDLGALRPDNVSSFSHIRHVTPEQNSGRSSIESDRMIIKKRTEWDVDYEPLSVPVPVGVAR